MLGEFIYLTFEIFFKQDIPTVIKLSFIGFIFAME